MYPISYIEKKRHGPSSFPIQYYYVDEKHHQYIMPTHWHKEFEIIRVLRGNIKIYLNSTEHFLSVCDILLVESGFLHRGEPNHCTYECIVFDLNMLAKKENDIMAKYILPLFNSSAKINNIQVDRLCDTGQAINTLFEILKNKPSFYEIKVYSLLYEIFLKLYSTENISPADKLNHSPQIEAITHLIKWIEKNYTETITLEMLSSISGFSEKYLCRIFKEYTSKTPITYINELRIEKACNEMTMNKKSITFAAYESGFNDLSYFCRTFKKYKNITPKEYIKNLNL